ncbi:MAG: glutamate-cysteine ligase family protein [Bdellovibrionota bacterium]
MDTFFGGGRPPERFQVGVEFERFALSPKTGFPLPYDGEVSVRSILKHFSPQWTPILDDHRWIGLKRGQDAITLEPGGQVELSSRAYSTVEEMDQGLRDVHGEMKTISNTLGFQWADVGFLPSISVEEASWMPKSRYKIMRQKYETRDRAFLEMMTMTASIQVNFDYQDEQDAKRKMFVSSMLGPVVAALYSNSSVEKFRASKVLGRRQSIWMHSDPDRTGTPAFFVDGSFSFERYMEYALDVPMYFIVRDGSYHDRTHQTFREYLSSSDDVQLGDWDLHLTTLFPDVRLKNHLEVRTADQNSIDLAVALGVFWFQISRSEDLLSALEEHFSAFAYSDLMRAYDELIHKGLHAELGGVTLASHAKTAAEKAIHTMDSKEQECFLPFFDLAQAGTSPGEMRKKRLSASAEPWTLADILKESDPRGKTL